MSLEIAIYFFVELLLHCFIVCCLHAWPPACLTTCTTLFWLEYHWQVWGEEWKDMHKGDKTAPIQPVNNNHNAPSTYESTWVEEPSLWWQVPAASLDPASVHPPSRPPWGHTESASHTTWYAQTPGSLPVNVNVVTKLQLGPEHCAHVTSTLFPQYDRFTALSSQHQNHHRYQKPFLIQEAYMVPRTYDVWATKVWNSPNIHKTYGSLLIIQYTLLLGSEWLKDRPIHTAGNEKRDWAGHGWHNCRKVGDTYHQLCSLFPNH